VDCADRSALFNAGRFFPFPPGEKQNVTGPVRAPVVFLSSAIMRAMATGGSFLLSLAWALRSLCFGGGVGATMYLKDEDPSLNFEYRKRHLTLPEEATRLV
jgi:hypothetical protein